MAWTYLLSGLILGLSSGIAPGPLLTLVVRETLVYSPREGAKVALAPVLTDVPIILVSVLAVRELAALRPVLGGISMAGGLYLFYLAYECLSVKGVVLDGETVRPSSLRKGVVTNFLNPHPYLFWVTVGGPMIMRGARNGWVPPTLFLLAMYVCLVGSKVVVALVVGRFRDFLVSRAYTLTMKFLGLVLALMALMLIRESFILWGVIGSAT